MVLAAVLTLGTEVGYSVAILLVVLGTVLDSVDGEVARWNESSSLSGLLLDRLNSIFLYPLALFGAGVGVMRGLDDISLVVAVSFVASWAMSSVRAVKAAIDSTVIDGLINPKAKQDGVVTSGQKHETGTELIRTRPGLHWRMVDFVLVRQLGFTSLLSAACLVHLALGLLKVDQPVWASPILIFVLAYAVLSLAALAVGIWSIVSNRVAESTFDLVRDSVLHGPESLDSRSGPNR